MAVESVSCVLLTLEVFGVVAGQSLGHAGCMPAGGQNFGVCPAPPTGSEGAAVHTITRCYTMRHVKIEGAGWFYSAWRGRKLSTLQRHIWLDLASKWTGQQSRIFQDTTMSFWYTYGKYMQIDVWKTHDEWKYFTCITNAGCFPCLRWAEPRAGWVHASSETKLRRLPSSALWHHGSCNA